MKVDEVKKQITNLTLEEYYNGGLDVIGLIRKSIDTVPNISITDIVELCNRAEDNLKERKSKLTK
jgi:hypothetical protein